MGNVHGLASHSSGGLRLACRDPSKGTRSRRPILCAIPCGRARHYSTNIHSIATAPYSKLTRFFCSCSCDFILQNAEILTKGGPLTLEISSRSFNFTFRRPFMRRSGLLVRGVLGTKVAISPISPHHTPRKYRSHCFTYPCQSIFGIAKCLLKQLKSTASPSPSPQACSSAGNSVRRKQARPSR
jgi:hypothetical protein